MQLLRAWKAYRQSRYLDGNLIVQMRTLPRLLHRGGPWARIRGLLQRHMPVARSLFGRRGQLYDTIGIDVFAANCRHQRLSDLFDSDEEESHVSEVANHDNPTNDIPWPLELRRESIGGEMP